MPAKVAFLMSSLYLLPARLDVTDLLGTDSAVLSPFCQVCAELPALAQCFKEDSNTSKSAFEALPPFAGSPDRPRFYVCRST